jgi:hypothetical protein
MNSIHARFIRRLQKRLHIIYARILCHDWARFESPYEVTWIGYFITCSAPHTRALSDILRPDIDELSSFYDIRRYVSKTWKVAERTGLKMSFRDSMHRSVYLVVMIQAYTQLIVYHNDNNSLVAHYDFIFRTLYDFDLVIFHRGQSHLDWKRCCPLIICSEEII